MIRIATLADVDSITAIYNEAVLEGGLTGDLEPLSIENRRAWFQAHRDPYAVFATVEAGCVAGYAALSPYRYGRKAFAETCELSYYLSGAHRGRGLGTELVNYAIEHAAHSGFRLMIALILECNRRSIGLLTTCGFSISGRLPEAAKIDDKHVDHLYLSRLILAESV